MLLVLCSLAIPFPSKAAQIPDERLGPRLADQEELLTTEEQEELLARLDEISERQQCDVVIVTVASIEGKTATEYAMIILIIRAMAMVKNQMEFCSWSE